MTSEEKQSIYSLLKTVSSWTAGFIPAEYRTEPPVFTDDITVPAGVQTKAAEKPQQSSSLEQKPKTEETGRLTLDSLYKKISECTNCILASKRIHAVPGEGCKKPYVLVIGEGPGEEEDKTGRPFVGRAGQLLDRMLAAIRLDRKSNCYIANIVKCRPPMNRTPMSDEAAACSGFLQAQIHILKPKLILAMGRTAVQNLMKTDAGINALRGKWLDLNGIPLLATYHPSAVLRDETLKKPVWDDLRIFGARLRNEYPEYDKDFHFTQGNS